MANKNINARFQNKHDIEANWLTLENFIPMQGEIIVYDVDSSHNFIRVKVGDGSNNINNLPFITDNHELKIYRQATEPIDALEGALWIDTDEEAVLGGKDGYTPKRGIDYWTAEDIAEIKSYIDTAILGGAW